MILVSCVSFVSSLILPPDIKPISELPFSDDFHSLPLPANTDHQQSSSSSDTNPVPPLTTNKISIGSGKSSSVGSKHHDHPVADAGHGGHHGQVTQTEASSDLQVDFTQADILESVSQLESTISKTIENNEQLKKEEEDLLAKKASKHKKIDIERIVETELMLPDIERLKDSGDVFRDEYVVDEVATTVRTTVASTKRITLPLTTSTTTTTEVTTAATEPTVTETIRTEPETSTVTPTDPPTTLPPTTSTQVSTVTTTEVTTTTRRTTTTPVTTTTTPRTTTTTPATTLPTTTAVSSETAAETVLIPTNRSHKHNNLVVASRTTTSAIPAQVEFVEETVKVSFSRDPYSKGFGLSFLQFGFRVVTPVFKTTKI